ncbi:MAG: SpoIIE family protein phosphatase [Carboxylicivirga sp.]|jgi:serine phosphatase RsbU (regulator of sigma subunit)|nr:SpoIIE family protein phosphatase [Carboxylicivirga sp.]
MQKRTQLSLYTFLGVGLMVFVFGYIGINISINYFQKHYVKLQINVNKRQAQRMALILEKEINRGVAADSIIGNFQASITGTEHDKGFLCIYDTKKMQLVSHPNPRTLGMSFTEDFVFKDIDANSEKYIGEVYSTSEPAGGIFIQGKMRTDIIYTVPIKGANWYLNAHENINAISSELKALKDKYTLGSLIIGLIIAISASVIARRISRRHENLIEQKNIEITNQRDEIAIKNQEITDSINYAQKIQNAVLPDQNLLDSFLSESFVFYRPKDIVSGDFYWFAKVDNNFVIVAADCTGHGVPGALMSMLSISLLNELISRKKLCTASEILNELRNELKTALGQKGDDYEFQDGIDLALCVINDDKTKVQFAGAYNPLYVVSKEANDQCEIKEYKGDRMPIGVHPKDQVSFTNREIDLKKDDSLYIFSDGFISQFGGETGGKYKSKRLKELLLSVQDKSMLEQQELITEEFMRWKGSNEQVDDILLIGFKA